MYCLKNDIYVITFPTPYPKIWQFLQYHTYDFVHDITNILDIPVLFIFCIVFDAINEMQMLFAVRTVLSYLPRTKSWKYMSQEIRQKLV